MNGWRHRSSQVTSLFNPAFCGAVLLHAFQQYSKEKESAVPFPLPFIMLPFSLNARLRSALPESTRTPFEVWIRREPQVRIGLAQRVKVLVPITRDALVFLAQRGLLHLADGCLDPRSRAPRGISKFKESDLEIQECFQKARIFAVMLARADGLDGVFAGLGLTL